jgi:hypothetical protein
MRNAGFLKWRVALAGAGLLIAVGFASPAAAQRSDEMKTGQGGGGHPCAGDAQRLCGDAIPDRAKVASCLFKNKPKLSSACRAEMGGGKAKVTRKAKGKRTGKRKRRR